MFDVIVVGAGVQGLSTANYLVESGKKVLILEQFPFPHHRGSSHGSSRITRYSYHKPFYVDMMRKCFECWDKLARKTGLELFNNCGLLTVGSAAYCEQVNDNLKRYHIAHEILDREEIRKKFSGFSCASDEYAVYEPSGGVLLADKCLQALQQSIRSGGGMFRDGEKMIRLEQDATTGAVRVVTSKSTYEGKRVVLTCGSWINKLVKPFGIQYPVKPLKINVMYWKTKNPNMYDIKNFPATIIETKHVFYSLPIMEYPGHMKVCYHYGIELDPDEPAKTSRENQKTREEQYEFVVECVKRHYPHLEAVPSVQEDCIYTNTPDQDLILEYLPGSNRKIVVGAGFSGHGFKLAPAVGHILGDLALGTPPPYDIAPFSSDRFGSASKM